MQRIQLPSKAIMEQAIALAYEAYAEGEVPVGAVVVYNGEVIGRGRNRREASKRAVSHAEIEAIDEACVKLNNWRLSGCEIYVTLEPCPMCTGAILNARIAKIVYGAADERAGCCGTALDLLNLSVYQRPELYKGFMETECRRIIKDFFIEKRETSELLTNKAEKE